MSINAAEPMISFNRAQTAIAMAKAENHALQSQLLVFRNELIQLIERIEAFIPSAASETDSWYETIVAEHDAAQRRSG